MAANNLKNETLYRNLLRKEVDGECIWWPCELGQVGDCGYIEEDGHFVKFFNVFDLPEFGPRPQDQSILRSQALPNRNVAYGATFSADATAEIGGAPAGCVTLNFTFSSKQQAGAFLQPLGSSRVQEKYLRPRTFARYLATNFKTILAEHGQDRDIRSLMIVKGVIRAPQWCRGLVHSEGSSAQGSLKLQGGAANAGVGLATAATHHPQVQWGPDDGTSEAVNTWQGIVVQPVYVTFAQRWFRTFMGAVGVPTTPGTISPSVEQRGTLLSSAMAQGTSGAIGVGSQSGYHSRRGAGDLQELSQLQPEDFSESGKYLDGYEPSAPDAIQQLLDRTLELHPEFDAIVWEWDTELVCAFEDIMAQSGSIETAVEHVLFKFDVMSSTSGRVGIARPYNVSSDAAMMFQKLMEESGFNADTNLLLQQRLQQRPEEFVGGMQSLNSGRVGIIGFATNEAAVAHGVPAPPSRAKILGVAGDVTCSIYPVLDSALLSADLREFLNLISQVHSHRIDYLEQLDSCHVSRVSHYRLDAQGHEVIVLHMVYSCAGNSSDARCFRLERFRDDPSNRESLAYSIDLATSPSRTLDTVSVSNALQGGAYELLSPKYQIVREFDIPPGTLTILEALVIAQTLSDLSNRYTLFVHMCQFWAVNLFLIIKAVVNSRNLQQVTLTDGPAINTAGTFRGLRLVEVNTGRATADFLRCDDKSLRALCKGKSTVELEAIKKVWSQASSLELGGPLTSAHPARNGTASDDDISTNAVYHTAQMNLDAWKVKIRAEISRMGSVS